jgi:Domain of unknown function (DUF333)
MQPLRFLGVLAFTGMFVVGCGGDEEAPQIANPATVYCKEQGGVSELETGTCVLPDGTRVDEWDYFRQQTSTTQTGPSTTSAEVSETSATIYPDATGPTPPAAVTTLSVAIDAEAITAAFASFFDGTLQDIEVKVAAVEHGEQLRSMLSEAMANPQFGQMSTQVSAVRSLDSAQCAGLGLVSPCAEVTHDVLVGQFPAIVDHVGHAVEIDGSWRVAAETWCDVVKIGGAECPAI